jgi:protein-S-isoprenylcysteine O-methyltransferase Ste14
LAVALDSLWVLALLVPVLATMQVGVVAREERYLEAKFGDDYRAYKQTVRRWL